MSTSLSTRIAGEFLGAGLMIGSSALDVSIANLRIAVDRHLAAQAAASSETATQVPVTVAVAMSV